MTRIRSYSELRRFKTFEERFNYLKLTGQVGASTFGFDRYMNQMFYRSTQWKQVRSRVIARDLGMDLGIEGFEIHDKVIIHHMNPMTADDITGDDSSILDPEFLISTTLRTHNAIHFGSEMPQVEFVTRRQGDTKLW